jgi:uncharacterized Zn finger protein
VNRWDRFEWRAATKQPAPEHGIKVKKAGTTWWGERWIAALERVLRGDAGRLARGKSYARAGRVHDLTVTAGTVTARVTGTRPTPYQVRIELGDLGDETWSQALAAMAAKAQFSAELLAGRMPAAIDEAFGVANASLFPRARAELVTSCSCPDSGDPCKHVAATHYVLGEALDSDPFLLFELRGRTKERVLDALRAARHAPATPARKSRAKTAHASGKPSEAHAPEIPSVKLGKLTAATYDPPRAALPALQFSFEEPVAHGAMLRQLGAPAGWQNTATLEASFSPLVRAAAETARRLALGEPPDASPQTHVTPSESPPTKPTSRRKQASRHGRR